MKKVMRSVLLLALAGVMVFSMAACGEKKVEEPETPVVEVEKDETDISESELKSEEVEVSLTMSDIADTLMATYGENFIPSVVVEKDVFADLTGITEDMYEEMIALMAPMSAHCDLLYIVRATDEHGATVIEKLEAYKDSLVENNATYPNNLPKIEASVVDVKNDLVVLRILGAYYEPETTEDGEVIESENEAEKIKEFYAEQVKLGTDALELLYSTGFTAMSEEERAEKGVDALYFVEEVVEETEEPAETEDPAEVEEEATETEDPAEVEEEATETEENTAANVAEKVGEAVGEVAETVVEGAEAAVEAAEEVVETEKTEDAE